MYTNTRFLNKYHLAYLISEFLVLLSPKLSLNFKAAAANQQIKSPKKKQRVKRKERKVTLDTMEGLTQRDNLGYSIGTPRRHVTSKYQTLYCIARWVALKLHYLQASLEHFMLGRKFHMPNPITSTMDFKRKPE